MTEKGECDIIIWEAIKMDERALLYGVADQLSTLTWQFGVFTMLLSLLLGAWIEYNLGFGQKLKGWLFSKV